MRTTGNEDSTMVVFEEGAKAPADRPDTVVSVLGSTEPPTLWQEIAGEMRNILGKSSSPSKRVLSVMHGLFPILRWGRNYNLALLRCDLMAGLTVASLAIPECIGYAGLAKLEPQYGLYTSIVPPLVYAVMGSSREIAVGPVAVVSLLLSSMLQKVVDPAHDPVSYRNLVLTTSFFAGLFQAGFGLFRMGFLADFLSHAALVGFMGGAAIVIGLQQLKGFLGISHFTNETDVVSVVRAVFEAIQEEWHPYNFALGCSFLLFILTTKFIGKRNKKLFWLPAISPLISVILSTLLVFTTRADKHGVKIIRHLKGGPNPSSANQLEFSGPFVGIAAKSGLVVAVIALTEAIAVGRSFASINGYHIDGNKEMVAMGCMNIVGSLSSCYAATGSFSRTAVNYSAGCKTVVSDIVMAVTVFVSLELMTKLLYYTPTAILASIILAALPALIHVAEAYSIWEVDKLDFLVCIGAFFGVLFGSVEIGLVVALSISFVKIILNAIRPRIEVLGKIPGANAFCGIRQYPVASQIAGILIIRIDSSMWCFTNSNFIRERIMGWVAEQLEATADKPEIKLKAVVIDMSSVTNVDTSGIAALEEVHKDLLSHCVQVMIVNPGWEAIHKMKLARLADRVGENFFLTVREAVDAWLASAKNCDNDLQC